MSWSSTDMLRETPDTPLTEDRWYALRSHGGEEEIEIGMHGSSVASHLSVDSRIRDLQSHPAFAGFGRVILPKDDRAYDENMRLRDIHALLPYHSHVDPATVVNSLNRMIDDVNDGRRVFYSFYTERQKRAEPSKENTGLFFFRGRPGAPFAVVSPGGGFVYVGSLHEGFPYAAAISGEGYNAFVLRYRAGASGRVATEDLAAAISFVFRMGEKLGVDVRGYSLWGSSAGARMAAAIGSYGTASYGGDDLPMPSVVVMAYTAYSDHTAAEPPTFVVVGGQDQIAPPSTMERRIAQLQSAGTPVEYHKYTELGHGFGLGTDTSAEGWVVEAVRFWEKYLRLNDKREQAHRSHS
jgi:acetyl esterase/lipase